MRPGAFGVSLNQRMDGTIIDNIFEALFVHGVRPSAWMIREALESDGAFSVSLTSLQRGLFVLHTILSAPTYAAAVSMFHTSPIPAPCYIIVSGVQPGEGVVISRWRNGGDLWHIDLAKQRWFLPQTNDDHWKPPQDRRRETIIKGMNAIGQENISLDGLFTVLSTQPVLNPDMVTYTTLMSAQTGNYTAFIRFL